MSSTTATTVTPPVKRRGNWWNRLSDAQKMKITYRLCAPRTPAEAVAGVDWDWVLKGADGVPKTIVRQWAHANSPVRNLNRFKAQLEKDGKLPSTSN